MIRQPIINGFNIKPYEVSHNKLILTTNFYSFRHKFDFEKYEIDSSIKTIEINNVKILNLHLIPSHIETIIFESFTDPIDFLPHGIKTLKIIPGFSDEKKFSHKLDNLPNTIEVLVIKKEYNLPIENLPNSLKHLEIEGGFNQPVNHLPSSLEFINLGSDFNQPINNLPQNLKTLITGKKFNQSINNLPPALEKLIIGKGFFLKIVRLPPNLKYLEFDDEIFCSDETYIDKQNKYTEFNDRTKYRPSVKVLPPNLETLIVKSDKICFDYNSLPSNLKKLYVRYCYLLGIPYNIAEKLKSINLSSKFIRFNSLPNSLEELIFDFPMVCWEQDENLKFILKEENDSNEKKCSDKNLESEEKSEETEESPAKKRKTEDKFKITSDERNDIVVPFMLPNVKKLVLRGLKYNCFFSSGIEKLTLVNCAEYVGLENLPDTLKCLEIFFEKRESDKLIKLDDLPDKLEYINYSGCQIENIDMIKTKYPSILLIQKIQNRFFCDYI